MLTASFDIFGLGASSGWTGQEHLLLGAVDLISERPLLADRAYAEPTVTSS
jgi:hypothetical protein